MYSQFNGVVLAAEEGKNIAKAIGNKKVSALDYFLCGSLDILDLGCYLTSKCINQ